MRPVQHKQRLFSITAVLYTLLFYPLYKLWGHQVIAAIHQGRLGRRLTFTGASFLPVAHYTDLADQQFIFIWLTPLCTVVCWIGLYALGRYLFFLRSAGQDGPSAKSALLKYDYLLAGLVYTLGTLALYFSFLPYFTDHVIGSSGDNLKYLWTMWWGNHALHDLSASFYFTKSIFYPEGTSLLYNDYSWYNLILSFLLRPVFGYTITYNLLIFHSYILSGLGCFALARHLTKNSLASLAAGVIFAFNPSHFAHALGHINITSIQFIPLFVLFYLKMARGGRWSHTALAGIFLLLNALCDWYYLIFCLMFIGLAYGYLCMRNKRLILPGLIGRTSVILLIAVIPVAPWLARMMLVALRDPGVYLGGHFVFVVDLLGLVLPLRNQLVGALLPKAIMDLNYTFTGNTAESVGYLGMLNIGLLAYAAIKIRENVAPYLLGFVCMVLFALGPLPHVIGHPIPVALPWLPLVKIPFVANARNPARFMVFVYVFLAIIAAFSLDHYLLKHHQSAKAKLVVGALAVLMFFDFYCTTSLRAPMAVPPAYLQMAQDSGEYGVLDLPGGSQSNKERYMFYSIHHGHPIVQGTLPRQVGTSLKDHLEYGDLARQKKQLMDNRVKYVVIHKRLIGTYDDKRAYSEPNITDIGPYLRTYDKVYEDDGQLLLRVY